jgi:hypothetical protein
MMLAEGNDVNAERVCQYCLVDNLANRLGMA